MPTQSTFHNLTHLFRRSFSQLKKTVSPRDIENLSSIVHTVMSGRERDFHTESHILDMSSSDTEGIETLAIICHDLVYAQIDKRIHPLLQSYLMGFQLDDANNLVLPDFSSLKDECLVQVYEVFGFKPGQQLNPFSGLNEFLSAATSVSLLKDYLSQWELLQLLSCIEATIPFRKRNDKGQTPSDLLFERLTEISTRYAIQKTEAEIIESVQMTVDVLNRDVSGFGSIDPGLFLTGTWKLIVESNPILKNPLYTVSQYRVSLAKMEGFLSYLTPEIIFREFKGKPKSDNFKALLERAKIKLKIGVSYLQVKITAIDLIHAICELTGGDAAMIIFLGNVTSEHGHLYSTLEHHLDPNVAIIKDDKRSHEVVTLLKLGRTGTSTFDLRHSPTASYLYERISQDDFEELILKSKAYGTKKLTAMHYLESFPKVLTYSMLVALSKIADTRSDEIFKLSNKLST